MNVVPIFFSSLLLATASRAQFGSCNPKREFINKINRVRFNELYFRTGVARDCEDQLKYSNSNTAAIIVNFLLLYSLYTCSPSPLLSVTIAVVVNNYSMAG